MRWQQGAPVRIDWHGLRLRATLYGGLGRVVAVQCHRLGSDASEPEGQALRAVLAPTQLPLLSLDFAGHGLSDGDFAATTYSTQMAQLAAALDYLGQRHVRRFVLFGAGMGGSVALLCAARDERAVAVATLSAIGRPAEHAAPAALRAALGPGFAADADSHDVVAAVGVLRAKVLICHGEHDEEVPGYEAEDLAAAAVNASLEVVLGGGHLFGAAKPLRPLFARVGEFLEGAARQSNLSF